MPGEYSALFEKIGYIFKDITLLEHALSHRSSGDINNERLEFLGDALLGVIIADALFRYCPQAREGDLSRMRSALVSGTYLADLARKLELGNHIKLGAGELKTGGRQRESILANAFEALIGAVYLDSDIENCRRCIFYWYGNSMHDLNIMQAPKDAKSHLQEWVQAHKFPLPSYTATVSGKPHEQIFVVLCEVPGLPHSATGSSTSRRKAEQSAAQNYLALLDLGHKNE
jgi:ribonuclease-3